MVGFHLSSSLLCIIVWHKWIKQMTSMPDLLLYSSTVDPSLFLFFSPSCYKHLLKQYLRLWTRPYCDEGKHISLGIQFAHHRHMPASTILFFTWPFSPLQQHIASGITKTSQEEFLLWFENNITLGNKKTWKKGDCALCMVQTTDIFLGWGFGETAL